MARTGTPLVPGVNSGRHRAGGAKAATKNAYADPPDPAVPNGNMELDVKPSALVVIDPQIDFMSAKGLAPVNSARRRSLTGKTSIPTAKSSSEITIGKSISTVDSGSIYGCRDKNGPTVEMHRLTLQYPGQEKLSALDQTKIINRTREMHYDDRLH